MIKYPEHDKEFFYKFTSIGTARKILENGSFRYSSPLSFNDPFDMQSELYFNFQTSDLPRLVANEVDALVCGRRLESIDSSSDWGKSIIMLQEQHQKKKYRREHLDYLVEPLIHDISSEIEITRSKYNEHMRKSLETMRVFCVADHNESILMWSHYADYHTGVCFKLKVLPEQDNPICVAKEVNYLAEPPSFFTVDEWVDSVVLNTMVDYSKFYHRYPLAKSNIWQYESEWRVWAPFEKDGNDYLYIPLVDGEIEAIYFGVKTDNKLAKDIIDLATKKGINKFYQAEKQITEYGLIYIEI